MTPKMELLFILLISLLSLYNTDVEAKRPKQARCIDLDPLQPTADLRLMMEKSWWVYRMTDTFGNHEKATHKNTDVTEQAIQVLYIPGSSSNECVQHIVNVNMYIHQNDPYLYIPNKKICLTLGNEGATNEVKFCARQLLQLRDRDQFITNYLYSYAPTDTRYAIFEGEVVGVAIFPESGPPNSLPLKSVFTNKYNQKVTEFALIYAEDEFLIFRTCDKKDTMVQIAKIITDAGQEDVYHEYIMNTLNRLNIPTDNLKSPKRSFPFPVNFNLLLDVDKII